MKNAQSKTTSGGAGQGFIQSRDRRQARQRMEKALGDLQHAMATIRTGGLRTPAWTTSAGYYGTPTR